jgi:putative ABC transport system permease protein
MIGPRTLLLFYVRHLRVQPLRESMAVLGVAVGVALLFTVQIANSSVTGSFETIVRGVAGRATLEVGARGPEGFDQSVYERVAHTPGVQAAAPLLEQRVVAVGAGGTSSLVLVGADERLAALGGRWARQLQRAAASSRRGLMVMAEPIARAIGARPGSGVAIEIGGRTEHLSLAASVPSAKMGPVAKSPLAATSLPVLQSVAGLPGRVTRILVEPAPGKSADVQSLLSRSLGPGLNVRHVGAEAGLLADAARPEGRLTALFSLICLVVGMVLAYNALLLASGERRAFIAFLHQLGAPDRAIVASLMFDAFVLGLVGCALGLVLGDVISLLAYRAAPGYLMAAFAIGEQRIIDLQTVCIAVGAGMLAAFAAAALPALGLLRSSAAEFGSSKRLLSLVGRPSATYVLVFAGGVALLCVAALTLLSEPSLAVGALVALVLGMVICIPMIVRYTLKGARALTRRSSDPAARLSVAELQVSPTRSVALVATGAIAVFLMVTIGGTVTDVKQAVRSGAAGIVANADLWVNPGGAQNVYSTEPFAYSGAMRNLRRLSVVQSVLPYRESFLDLSDRRVWVVGVPPQARTPIVSSQLTSGTLRAVAQRLRQGGWAAVSQVITERRHLQIGQQFSLPTPSGTARFRLAATISNYGWLPGTVLIDGDDYRRYWPSSQASQLGVTLVPGVSPEQGRLAVQRALPRGSALSVQTGAERRDQVSSVLGSTLARLDQTSTIVLIATIATVVALMVGAVWQRRGRLDALMSIGMSFTQLAKMVFYESGCVLLAGCVIGMAVGMLGQGLVDGWLRHTTGSPVQFDPAWQLGLRTILIAGLVSMAAAAMAVVRTVGFQPRAAFSTE